MSETDKQIINNIVDNPIDVRFAEFIDDESDGFDSLAELEKIQQSVHRGEPSGSNKKNDDFIHSNIFNETHKNVPLKEYIRKWISWVNDFHWALILKYFIDSLPTYKLHYFIKNYPSLDNFVLHWMWWSYTLSCDLERSTKDPFRAAGTMPWLLLDNNNHPDNLSNIKLKNCKNVNQSLIKDFLGKNATLT